MNLLFVGGGNMATAIIGGLLAKRWPAAAIHVTDVLPEVLQGLRGRYGVQVSQDAVAALGAADCVVLAVKPQQLREVARGLAPAIGSRLVISIAAGIRGADLARWLGGTACVVRAMPNTPALVSAGITGLCALPGVSDAQRHDAERVLAAVGETFWVNDERDLDAVTAVSGSGPAYVFYFIEALEQAAIELGLPPATARRSAIATVAGAVRLAAEGGADPSTLRARVTSKGGTTERAIGLLEESAVKAAVVRAVRGAAERAAELGDQLGKD